MATYITKRTVKDVLEEYNTDNYLDVEFYRHNHTIEQIKFCELKDCYDYDEDEIVRRVYAMNEEEYNIEIMGNADDTIDFEDVYGKTGEVLVIVLNDPPILSNELPEKGLVWSRNDKKWKEYK